MDNILKQLGKALTGLFRLIFGSRKTKFNRVQMLARWAEIENILNSGDRLHAAQAVIKADVYLDNVMKTVGARGATFADRLRSVESKIDKKVYQEIWRAHKFRNRIAHEHIEVSINEARAALGALRRGASQLGAF